MAEYLPPSENLPIFDVTVFRNDNPYSDLYLARIGLATSEAVQTDFSGLVNFNNISTPPHCSAVPINPNDLCNKAFVEALAPQTSYIVYLNYTETFTTTTPTIYKKLNPLEVYTPTLVPFATTNTTPVLIAGFFNTKTDLLFADVIPPGNWNLVLFANCDSANDQNHLELNYSLIGITAGGVETVIYTSAYSNTINVIAPQIGTYTCQLTLPSTSILAYTQIGVKVYIRSNINANRSGNIFFQYTSSYSSLQTSFGTTQASNILTTNNSWTGINTFTNTTNLNSTVIQSGTLTFPDATTQSTAYKALTAGSFTNTNIVVDANGAISSIANGTVPSTNAVSIDLTNTATGASYYMTYSLTNGASSILRAGGLLYNRDTNFLSTSVSAATNLLLGAAGQIPYQSIANTTLFTTTGTAGQVLISNAAAAPTWSTDIGGNAGSASTVAVTVDTNTSGNWYVPFLKTNSSTSNILYVEDATASALTYNANSNRLSAGSLTINSRTQTIGTNSSLLSQSTTTLNLTNNSTSGIISFNVGNSVPASVTPFSIDSAGCDTTVPMNVVTTITATSPSLTVKQSVSDQTINFTPFAPLGTLNPIVGVDTSIISCNGGGATRRLVITTDSATTVGIRMSNVAILMGAGGTAVNPSHYINFSSTTGISMVSSLVPAVSGYTLPAGSDSSTNIATTAWVQSAIPLGTSALASNVSGGLIGNVLYQSANNVTQRMTNGGVGTVLTSGGVGAVPTWETNLAGNAASATNVLGGAIGNVLYQSALNTTAKLANGTIGTVLTSGGVGANPTWETNLAGNAASATNVLGGAIGNVLYQSAPGVTAKLANGAATAGRILTSNGASSPPSWNNTFSGTATTATNAVNTGITNDLVSTTNHALTFVSNISGNLPQKTRADLGIGEGLIFIPSSTTLICRSGGVGTVSTNTVTVRDNLANTSDILESGGAMIIRNNAAGSLINLQTADAGTGTLANRMVIDENSIRATVKVDTEQGIRAPLTALTYGSDMVGYSVTHSFPGVIFTTGTPVTSTTGTIGIGVWMLNCSQSILRGTGTFAVGSQTQQLLSIASGAGTITAITRMWNAIPSGSTSSRIGNFMTTTAIITSPATISIQDTITMTVGSATLTTGIVFTRIA